MDDALYTIVMDTHRHKDTVIYLIIRQSDIGHYIVAETYSATDAKVIANALSTAENLPPPF